MLILPFFIIKLKGVNLTINEYIEVLKTIISNHSIGKLFTEFHTVDLNQKIYILVSAIFYVFSIYQNILTFRKFNDNMTTIHKYFNEINTYLEYTVNSMNNYLKHSGDLNSHQDFNDKLKKQIEVLIEFKEKIVNFKKNNFVYMQWLLKQFKYYFNICSIKIYIFVKI